ncbi:MAG: hypothetical protein ABIA04_15695 [Pseudomonadota bacterium]
MKQTIQIILAILILTISFFSTSYSNERISDQKKAKLKELFPNVITFNEAIDEIYFLERKTENDQEIECLKTNSSDLLDYYITFGLNYVYMEEVEPWPSERSEAIKSTQDELIDLSKAIISNSRSNEEKRIISNINEILEFTEKAHDLTVAEIRASIVYANSIENQKLRLKISKIVYLYWTIVAKKNEQFIDLLAVDIIRNIESNFNFNKKRQSSMEDKLYSIIKEKNNFLEDYITIFNLILSIESSEQFLDMSLYELFERAYREQKGNVIYKIEEEFILEK